MRKSNQIKFAARVRACTTASPPPSTVLGRVHGEVFGAVRPATAMIGVASLLHPDMLVEVEADAVRGAGS